MNVHWTNHALNQLFEIYSYISQDSKFYATKVIDDLTKTSKNLEKYSHIGRKVPEINNDNIREIIHGHYRIIYKINEKRIDIIALIHTAQQFFVQPSMK